ncbi:MAG: hypothetical protein HZB24_10570, partial [Desulfobacterales bacterium]|nr:hypothetical protein [Desulfobacterales bacterium]
MRSNIRLNGVLSIFFTLTILCAILIGCDGGSSSSGGTATCATTKLRTIPVDPSVRGPWTVGSRTVTVGTLKTEVWYPAVPGSEAGKT